LGLGSCSIEIIGESSYNIKKTGPNFFLPVGTCQVLEDVVYQKKKQKAILFEFLENKNQPKL
jgi:hypothetical protein